MRNRGDKDMRQNSVLYLQHKSVAAMFQSTATPL